MADEAVSTEPQTMAELDFGQLLGIALSYVGGIGTEEWETADEGMVGASGEICRERSEDVFTEIGEARAYRYLANAFKHLLEHH